MSETASLFTCRYWAFGSSCPNTLNGRNICKFAHWDTGLLASEKDQRGTCKHWLQGTCNRGHKCWYEHRDTGVEGLYQGPVRLHGFDLDIANAAAKAGFNTWNHSALFDLIWAVKRVALRSCKSKETKPQPPKNPIYPDRYRPSGIGDNTKRKRIAPSQPPPAFKSTSMKLEPTAKILPNPPRRQHERRHKSRVPTVGTAFSNAAHKDKGTYRDPLILSSDDNDDDGCTTAYTTLAKKRKLNSGASYQPRVEMKVHQPHNVADDLRLEYVKSNSFTEHSDFISFCNTDIDEDIYDI